MLKSVPKARQVQAAKRKEMPCLINFKGVIKGSDLSIDTSSFSHVNGSHITTYLYLFSPFQRTLKLRCPRQNVNRICVYVIMRDQPVYVYGTWTVIFLSPAFQLG